jgi:hypothetical protein
MNRTRVAGWLGIIAWAVLAGGCGTRGMRVVPQATVSPPGSTEAVVVFMRPAFISETYSTSVFDLRPEGDRFVAIVRAQTRFAYRTAPGRTRFMLVSTGRPDQFMDADLAPGKTYYASITHEVVDSATTYVLRPVRGGDLENAEIKACLTECAWVENTEKSDAWGRAQLRNLAQRKARSLPAWEARNPRPALTAADGR